MTNWMIEGRRDGGDRGDKGDKGDKGEMIFSSSSSPPSPSSPPPSPPPHPHPTPHTPIPNTPLPLSFAQQRLWFLYQLAPDNPFYNVPAAIRFRGTLDQVALERSFHEIVRRHATLRTTFTILDGQPVQVVHPQVNVPLSVVNLQTVAVGDRDRVSQQLATAEARRSFNLTTDSLLRVTLLQFDPTDAVLLLTMHHIVADGWSLGVLIRELACCYTAFSEGNIPALPPLPIQYTDFAQWQRNWLQGEVLEKQLTYWRKQLHDLPVLHLPSDRPRPAMQTYRGATYPLHISPPLTQALAQLSQQSGVSLFMTLLAAFQTLLYRYTGQDDMAIGCPIANRHRSEIEGLIGFFVNSLVLRTDLSGNPTFRELLDRVRDIALEAYEHQDLPFEKLVEDLDPDRNLSRNPLFQVAFALQNAPMRSLELPGLTLDPAPLESSSTRFDLEVHLWEPAHGLGSVWRSQDGLSGFIAYSTDLFDRDRISRLVGHFQTVLEGIVANPNARLSDLPLLTPVEQTLLAKWSRSPNQSEVPLSKGDWGESNRDLCFHHLFEAQVQRNPDAIALVTETGSLTYGELNQHADRLAETLKHMGVQPNHLVGLCVDRSADMVTGILGILKAGGAYVPLDPNYPSDRLQFMLSDTQVSILLTQSWLVKRLPRSQAQILCLDQPFEYSSTSTLTVGDRIVTSDPLAYVIYTSGSTGTPKGVLLSHRGLCNVVAAQQQIFHLSAISRILQFSSLSFDASIFEIALALGSGGTLYIPPKSAQIPGHELLQFLEDHAITHALLTPAVLAVLPPADLPALQVLITGGEACSSQIVDRWAANRHFFNAYGPTETTIWATVAELHPNDHPLTIGRPILNTQVYILDANLNPVPIGIPGELDIGGKGLACGYLNRPELTAEKFIHHPSLTPSRLYRTGDRAFYHPDGSIEFLGRIDHQIKIRGFRVELGEIEATLQRHPAIQDAVVIASKDASHEMRLIAYFTLNHAHIQQTIQSSLQTQHLQHWQTLYNHTYHLTSNIQVKEAEGRGQKAEGEEQHPTPNTQYPNTGVRSQEPEVRSYPTPYTLHPTPPLPNITGWNSSYTGDPIPLEQMQEWVSDRVQQILALKPKRVLEIGCGTGLLLFQIAPHCETYVGTDFSAAALQSIQTQLNTLHLPQVQLLQRMATDFEGFDATSFDVVILNSIVQYFPSVDYLIQVLDGVIQTVAPGGVLFVGDVRNGALLTAFHTWVQFCRADAGMNRTQFQQAVERSQFEEPELAIDPTFFQALRDRFPQIQHVQIRLSRGQSLNEMTQFRYNVLLHIEPLQIDKKQEVSEFHNSELGQESNSQTIFDSILDSIQQHDWKCDPITVTKVQDCLGSAKPNLLVIKNITNSRVDSAVQLVNWMHHKKAPKTVGRMRELLQNSVESTDRLDASLRGIDPQDWWDLETVLPYSVEITWSSQSHTGDYDVQFIRHGIGAHSDWFASQSSCVSWHHYANEPLQSQFARQLMPELRQYLKQTLPDYMVPSAFMPLAALPLTVNGKVDRRALPSLDEEAIRPPGDAIAPSTPTELTLTEIWQDLLRLKQVNPQDNFFELGGHSLLATQMTSRVRDAFGLELPLKSVFEAPTIAQLAPILDTLRDTNSITSIPPLVRLDRSAYRRKRSPLPAEHPPIPQVQEFPQPTDHADSTDRPASDSRSPLVPLTLGNSQQPFFCVHPMFGVVFPYLELAHHLRSDRSFYGLQPLGLDGQSAPLNRIEAIAAYYIQAIQTRQPQGPYFLGGWSFGGLVAFEMAQQLVQSGQQVGLLAILDTTAPGHKLSLCQSLKFLLGTALWSTLPFLLDYSALATTRLQSWNAWFSRWQWSAIARQIPEESRLQVVDESAISPMLRIVYANAQAAYRYVPRPYGDRITLFKATEQIDATGHDPTLGWSTLANDIQLHDVPGNHLSFLKQPHVQILAQQLDQYLA